MTNRLLLLEPHDVVFHGMREMLNGTEFEIIGRVFRCFDALNFLSQQTVDMIILETRLPNENGLSVLERLRLEHPRIPILVFSDTKNPAHVAQCNALGAAGFRGKESTKEELVDAIGLVAQGHRLWTVDEIRKLTGAMSTPRLGSNYEVSLTNREVQVLGQMAEGATNKEIASGLGISFETVKEHVQHILKKVGVADRTQAVVWAVRTGVI